MFVFFSWRDVLGMFWNGLKDGVREIVASRFVQGVVVGAVLASAIWAIVAFGR
ncbi:MAG: hypothetical protein AAB974_00060 [Patescibacteria group bacterium]